MWAKGNQGLQYELVVFEDSFNMMLVALVRTGAELYEIINNGFPFVFFCGGRARVGVRVRVRVRERVGRRRGWQLAQIFDPLLLAFYKNFKVTYLFIIVLISYLLIRNVGSEERCEVGVQELKLINGGHLVKLVGVTILEV